MPMTTLLGEPTASASPSERAHRPLRPSVWVALVLSAALLQLGAVAALNYVVDPRAEFPSDAFEPMVLDARVLKVRMYGIMDPKPETIIFGSSRALTVSPAVLEEHGFGPGFNFAVNSGKATDALEVYKQAEAVGAPPRDLVLITEDWFFQQAHQTPWPDAAPTRDPVDIAKRLVLSARSDYVRESWHSLQAHAEGLPRRDRITEDGTMVRDKTDYEMATGTYDYQHGLDLLSAYAKPFYESPLATSAPQAEYIAAFDALLARAEAHGTRVHLVIPPMTEEAKSYVKADAFEASFAATRALLLDVCGPDVHVYDLSDPTSYGATGADFTDGYHPTTPGGVRLTHAIADARDLCQESS